MDADVPRNSLQHFIDQSGIDIMRADLFHSDTIEHLRFENTDPIHSVEVLRAYQRLLRIAHPSTDHGQALPGAESTNAWADALVARGLTSAYHIAAMPAFQFISEFTPTFGSTEAARTFHQKAVGRATMVKHLWANIQDVSGSPHYRATRFFNVAPSLETYLAQIPSYQDLFGGLDYIVCPHCASIFSPAAYFLDLMRIIDLYISSANQGPNGIPPGYTLAERRPDLFDLKLDCRNTDELVPFLSIVVDVLAARIKLETDIDAKQAVAIAKYPFNLPYNGLLWQIRAHLTSLNTTLYAIYDQLDAAPIDTDREYLRVSAEVYQRLTTILTTNAEVAPLYGYNTLDLNDIAKVNVFLDRTGLNRQGLLSLLEQNMTPEELNSFANTLYINDTDEALPYLRVVVDKTDPKNPFEKIEHLSFARLDRLRRFIQLSAILGWSYADTDWAMKSVGATEIQGAFSGLSAMSRLRSTLDQPIDVTIALWYLVKQLGRGDGVYPQDLFDRVFNRPSLLRGDPYAPKSQEPFDPARPLTWQVNGANGENALIRHRLVAALNISDNDLTLVAQFQVCLLARQDTLLTDLPTLTALYRLARLPQLAKIAVSEYLMLLRMMYGPTLSCVDRPPEQKDLTVEDIATQFEIIAWTKASGFGAPHLQYILTGVAVPDLDTGYDSKQIVPFVNSLATLSEPARLTFASFVFEDLDADASLALFKDLVVQQSISHLGILLTTEIDFTTLSPLFPLTITFAAGVIGAADSRIAYESLVAHHIIIPTIPPDVGALAQGFNAETNLSWLFEMDPNGQYKRNQVRSILLQCQRDITHTVSTLLAAGTMQEAAAANSVAGFFGIDSTLIDILIPFAAGVADLSDYLNVLLTPLPPGQPVPLKLSTLMLTLARIIHLLKMLQFTPAETRGMFAVPAAFDIASMAELTLDNIRTMWTFKELIKDFKDQNNSLLAYFAMPDTKPSEKQEKLQALANLTGWNFEQIEQLVTLFWPESQAYGTVAGVARLKRVFTLSSGSGLNIPSLLQLEALSTLNLDTGHGIDSAVWQDWQTAADATLDAVNAHYGNDGFPAVLAAIEATDDAAGRDVYVPYLIWLLNKPALPIQQISDLSQYLLIDVEMTDCDSISYIAQGISSLQLYLQRCRLAIEPGINSLPIPQAWWSWMAQYRLWEVNRKIYLYPENYVDPTLRGSRTPQFAALQETLLQSEIREDTVEAALRTYLDDFSQLAQLRIIGAYRFDVPDDAHQSSTDTVFLIGRSNTDPYTFYWRTIENYQVRQNADKTWSALANWTPWNKISLTIPAPFVTPVYAFGKQMLFWVEFEKITNSVITSKQQSEDHTVWTSSLRYSFMDFRGSWVQPQTLESSIVVDFIPDTQYLETTFIDPVTFSPTQMYWQRVSVLHVPPGRSTMLNGLEQILLFYGNQFRFFPGQNIIPVNPCAAPYNPNGCDGDFADRVLLNEEIFTGQRMVKDLSIPGLQARGSLVMKPSALISSTLLTQNQRVVLLNSLPNVTLPTPYTGAMVDQKLKVTPVASVLVGDYYYDQTIPRVKLPGGSNDEALPAASGELLGSLASTNTSLWTVKNQPGWFVYDNGDDVFLVASQQLPLLHISDILHVTDDLGVFPPALYAYTDAYTTNPIDPNDVQFAFTRLGTSTVAALSQDLFSGGIQSLLSMKAQLTPELPFSRLQPGSGALNTTTDSLDFNGAYGPYFWEIFFHSVFLSAEQLRSSQHFDEARIWLQYVFDPTARTDDGPIVHPSDRYWRFLPFRNFTSESLRDILTNVEQITRYNDDPFDPDAIARLRKSAYPKATVMRYIDNLLDWGDALFSQDTRESITQATNLYLLASDLLGKRPQSVRTFRQPVAKSYREISALYDIRGTARGGTPTSITLATSASAIDDFYNGLSIEITDGAGKGQQRTIDVYSGASREASVTRPWITRPDTTSQYAVSSIPQFLIDLENTSIATDLPTFASTDSLPYNDISSYFCVPENAELIAYWDKVEDRLYKIRHCMNIQGVERSLALFEPPLDVRNVVRAAAAQNGMNVESTPEPPIPFYRFEYSIERAKELTSSLMQLGSALLSALTTEDAELLNLLRTTQERTLLNLTTNIRINQVNEAIANRGALDVSLASSTARSTFYKDLIQQGLSPQELANLQAMESALVFNVIATILKTASAIGYALPQVGSPFAMTYGGQQIGNVLNAMAGVAEIGSFVSNYIAQRTQTTAGYNRRDQDWSLQALLADFDTGQINKQIEANDILRQIAERELTVHQESLLQNQELDDFFRRKFSSKDLFQWMAGRLSLLYFQTYTLAFDLARTAQRAYQYEGNTSETFIKFDYYNPAYRGLLAGEGLLLSLNQMQSAWLNKHARTLEISKTISLARLDPLALLALREQGECIFSLTEQLFDLDFPGHYCRKIKTISISIPAIVGPYQNVKATLTQLANQTVLTSNDISVVRFLLGEDTQPLPGPDKLRTNWWIHQQVALSTGTNDSGMFELNFSDPRYLPFEGTGAVSNWRLSMPKAANRINFSSISDVVISLKYTALDGGSAFRDQVVGLEPIKTYASGHLFLLARQFPTQWFAFMQDHASTSQQTLSFPIDESIIPPHVELGELTGIYVQLLVKDDANVANQKAYITLTVPDKPSLPITIPITIGAQNSALVTREIPSFSGPWNLTFTLADTPAILKDGDFLDADALLDVALILYFKGNLIW